MQFSPSALIIGLLAPVLGLSVTDSIWVGLVGCIAGAAGPAWCATLCPRTGLRQIAVSRFTFGMWGARICAMFNVIVSLCYAIQNAIVGGTLIAALSGGSVPTFVGIIIVVTIAFVVCLFGIRWIH